MKNLQALLCSAAFVSMMPSTIVLCSDEVTAWPEESTEASTIERNQSVHTRLIIITIDKETADKSFKNFLMHAVPTQLGLFGTIAGAAGSHSLKKVKRTIAKATNLTPETRYDITKELNK